eukprot:RCo041320
MRRSSIFPAGAGQPPEGVETSKRFLREWRHRLQQEIIGCFEPEKAAASPVMPRCRHKITRKLLESSPARVMRVCSDDPMRPTPEEEEEAAAAEEDPEEGQHKVSRQGAPREEVESHVCEGDLYLEVILEILASEYGLEPNADRFFLVDRNFPYEQRLDEIQVVLREKRRIVIVLENSSCNTGQNVEFTTEMLQRMRLAENGDLRRLAAATVLIQNPYLQKRAVMTVERWMGACPISCAPFVPQLQRMHPVEQVMALHLAVGELQRLKAYSEAKPVPFFRCPPDLPAEWLQAAAAVTPLLLQMRTLLGEQL